MIIFLRDGFAMVPTNFIVVMEQGKSSYRNPFLKAEIDGH
jgi:hypothetical protein